MNKETETQELKKQVLKRIKNPIFWIDNFLLMILLIIVIFAQIDGMFIRNEIHVIETCQGTPLDLELMTELENKGLIQKWNQTEPIKTNSLNENYLSKND